jgi:hypothetical protein
MHTSSIPHGDAAGSHRRLAALAVAVTAVAVAAGISLADLRAPADADMAASALVADSALASAARSRHSPLAETAPASALGENAVAAEEGEPLIKSAE